MKFIAAIVLAAVLGANGGCGDDEPLKYARRRDASQASGDASADGNIVDSGVKPPKDGGTSGGTGGAADGGGAGAAGAADGGGLDAGRPLAFVFHDDSTVPLPLRLSEDRLSLELKHSGVLGVLAPERTSESTLGMPFTSGWQEELNPGICSAFAPRSKWRHYECANTSFCQDILSWCCVDPSDTNVGCTSDDGNIYNNFLRAWVPHGTPNRSPAPDGR